MNSTLHALLAFSNLSVCQILFSLLQLFRCLLLMLTTQLPPLLGAAVQQDFFFLFSGWHGSAVATSSA